jgi:hypothetical protein
MTSFIYNNAITLIVLAFVGGGCLGVLTMALMCMAADPLDVGDGK